MAPISLFPVVDFSNVVSENSDQRSDAIQQLLKACQEWGCFMLVNHGMPAAQIDAMLATVKNFFDSPEDEKRQYEGDLRLGDQDVIYMRSRFPGLWRDAIRLHVHSDQSGFSNAPKLLREVVSQCSQLNRKINRTLMEAISEALELEKQNVSEVLGLDSNFQIFGANVYPPCPEEVGRATGLPEHTDASLFTTVMDGGLSGLQMEKDGQWFDCQEGRADHRNPIWVNVGDMLQIFSNGRLKSVKHRVVVKREKERISIAVTNYASLEAIVQPATALVLRDGKPRYEATTYKNCFAAKFQHNNN